VRPTCALAALLAGCQAFSGAEGPSGPGPSEQTPQSDADAPPPPIGPDAEGGDACAAAPEIFHDAFDGDAEGTVLDAWSVITENGALSFDTTGPASSPRALVATGQKAYLQRPIAATACVRCEARVRLEASSGEVRYLGIERAPEAPPSRFAVWDVAMNKTESALMLLQYALDAESGQEIDAYPTAPLPPTGEWLSVRITVDIAHRRALLQVNEEVLEARLPDAVPPQLSVYLGVRGRSGTAGHEAAFDDLVCFAK
jgi:hypothetical protein